MLVILIQFIFFNKFEKSLDWKGQRSTREMAVIFEFR